MEQAETLKVLEQLERGEISADQADARLNAPPVVERVKPASFDRAQWPAWIPRIGMWTLFAGVITIVIGAWIITATYRDNIFLFLIGLAIVLWGTLVTTLGAGTWTGHWIYVNIDRSRTGKRAIRFGVPLPISLLRLGLGLAQFNRPRAGARVNVSTDRVNFNALWEKPDEFISALERELGAGRGITIEVDDKNERVQVYIV